MKSSLKAFVKFLDTLSDEERVKFIWHSTSGGGVETIQYEYETTYENDPNIVFSFREDGSLEYIDTY